MRFWTLRKLRKRRSRFPDQPKFPGFSPAMIRSSPSAHAMLDKLRKAATNKDALIAELPPLVTKPGNSEPIIIKRTEVPGSRYVSERCEAQTDPLVYNSCYSSGNCRKLVLEGYESGRAARNSSNHHQFERIRKYWNV